MPAFVFLAALHLSTWVLVRALWLGEADRGAVFLIAVTFVPYTAWLAWGFRPRLRR